MKKNTLFYTLYIITFIVVIFNTVFSVVKSLTPSFSDLPNGEYISTSESPVTDARIDFYLVKNNMGSAVKGEYVDGDIKKTIYWQTNTDTVNVKWTGENTVTINDLPLNIKDEEFDSRRGTAIFSEGVPAERKRSKK